MRVAAPAAIVAPAIRAAAAEPEEAVVAAVEAAAETAGEAAPWPGDGDEASFLAETRARGDGPLPALLPLAAEETGPAADLPPLDQLVARVPAEVREALDDLFRAKFVRVRRVAPASLKS